MPLVPFKHRKYCGWTKSILHHRSETLMCDHLPVCKKRNKQWFQPWLHFVALTWRVPGVSGVSNSPKRSHLSKLRSIPDFGVPPKGMNPSFYGRVPTNQPKGCMNLGSTLLCTNHEDIGKNQGEHLGLNRVHSPLFLRGIGDFLEPEANANTQGCCAYLCGAVEACD